MTIHILNCTDLAMDCLWRDSRYKFLAS